MIGFAGDLWEVCRLITNLELFDNGISRISDWHYFIKKIDGSVKPAFGWFVLVMEFILLQKNFQIEKIKRNFLT
jgi:hypothetical protein